jgi:type IV secretion system protein VirB8
MFNKKRPEVRPDDASVDLSWEADVTLNLRRSARTAWRIAAGGFALASLLAVAVVLLIPLRKVVPYVYVVDKLTGEGTVVATAQDFVATSALNDKHWIKQFVISRERYNFRLLQFDYDNVKRMAGNGPWSAYDRLFQGESSLDKKFGENTEIIPTVLSITLAEGGLATVRYEIRTRDQRASAEPAVARRVATIRYVYDVKGSMREAEAIENPLGFTVTGYQTDPELVNQAEGAVK